MKQEFDTEKAANRIEVEESNNALDIHNIIKKLTEIVSTRGRLLATSIKLIFIKRFA